MARGFRNLDNMIALIYLRCSDLVVPLHNRPQPSAAWQKRKRDEANARRRGGGAASNPSDGIAGNGKGGTIMERGIRAVSLSTNGAEDSEKLAHTPRIIIPAQLIEEATDDYDAAVLNGCTYVDYDGFYVNCYIDYFCNFNPMKAFGSNVLKYVNSVLDTSMDQSLRDKYLYVKSRMDYCLSRNDGKQTSGMGKE